MLRSLGCEPLFQATSTILATMNCRFGSSPRLDKARGRAFPGPGAYRDTEAAAESRRRSAPAIGFATAVRDNDLGHRSRAAPGPGEYDVQLVGSSEWQVHTVLLDGQVLPSSHVVPECHRYKCST